jgi:hypothetical protein
MYTTQDAEREGYANMPAFRWGYRRELLSPGSRHSQTSSCSYQVGMQARQELRRASQ